MFTVYQHEQNAKMVINKNMHTQLLCMGNVLLQQLSPPLTKEYLLHVLVCMCLFFLIIEYRHMCLCKIADAQLLCARLGSHLTFQSLPVM